jgi:hypothetical protein
VPVKKRGCSNNSYFIFWGIGFGLFHVVLKCGAIYENVGEKIPYLNLKEVVLETQSLTFVTEILQRRLAVFL